MVICCKIPPRVTPAVKLNRGCSLKRIAWIPKETFSQKMSQPCTLSEQDLPSWLKKGETKAIYWIFSPHPEKLTGARSDRTGGNSFKLKEGGCRGKIFPDEGGEAVAQAAQRCWIAGRAPPHKCPTYRYTVKEKYISIYCLKPARETPLQSQLNDISWNILRISYFLFSELVFLLIFCTSHLRTTLFPHRWDESMPEQLCAHKHEDYFYGIKTVQC